MTVLLVGALAVVAGAQAPTAPAAPAWVKTETPRFVVYGGNAEVVTEVARQLEGFDALLAQTHPELIDTRRRSVPVLLLDGDEAVDAYVRPSAKERRRSGDDVLIRIEGHRPVVALGADHWQARGDEVRRRYAEAALDAHPRARPWLQVGLAEFHATARIHGDTAVVGVANPHHLQVLRENRRWIPFSAILAADRDSPLLDKGRHELFAAQAWLLVHWLQLDPERKRQIRLADLASATQRALVVKPASLEELSPGREPLEDQLRAWLAGDLPTQIVQIPFEAPAPPAPVPTVEVEYRLGTLLALQRRLNDAEMHFRSGLQLAPDSWMPHDGLGLVHASRQRWASARDAYDDAITRSPTDPAPYLDYGMATFHGLGRRGRRPAARQAFQNALALDPSLVDAYAGLSMLAYDRRDWTEMARWAGRGLQVDPADGMLRALLGRAQLANGDFDHAILNAQIALRECDDLDTCAMAQALYRATESRR